MQTFVKLSWVVVMTVLGVWMLVTPRFDRIHDTQRELLREIHETQTETFIATVLISRSVWYVVDQGRVSTEPDGKGQIVLLDEELMPMRSHMQIEGAVPNQKVAFSFATPEASYFIAGKMLTYEYL